MAKHDKKDEQPNNQGITPPTQSGGVVVPADFDDIEVARADEGITIEDILLALADPVTGEVDDTTTIRPIIVGSDYFWPAGRGLVIRGKVLGVEERQTSFVVDGKPIKTRFYTFELTRACLAIRSAELVPGKELPRPVQCNPGQHVAVLERTILRRLEPMIGKEVIVVCDGPARTKRGLNLWKYRAWEVVKVEGVRVLPDVTPVPALPASAAG